MSTKPDLTAPPEHLPEDAQAAWSEIVSGITKTSIDGIERPALEAYAVAVARMRAAQAQIHKEGMLVANGKGDPVPHPAIAIEKAATSEIRAWLQRYRRFVKVT